MTALDQMPVVAHVVRDGFVESVHHGFAVVTAPDGQVSWSIGDASDIPFFPRSANKPLQAVGLLRAGLTLTPEQLALAAASHSGEPVHLEALERMAGDLGVDIAALQNTPDLPYDEAARTAWLQAGNGPTSLVQNCSGKHLAMLAACAQNGWDQGTYRDPSHPLQQLIATAVSDLTGDEIEAVAVDGCGAPLLAVTPGGLARAFGRIAAAPADTSEGQVRAAMRSYPELVAGAGRDTTALLRAIDGCISKDGAEAVHAMGLADGTGVVVKVADGADRARPVLLAAVLRGIGLTGEVLDTIADVAVLGHGERVGAVVAAGDLAS